MDVSFIIVNWKTKDLVSQAIKSIKKYAVEFKWEIIVVDNNSQDGSVEHFKKAFPEVILIEKRENLGFGRANNAGIKVAKGDYIFFFNSDAYLIDNSLKKLINRARQIPGLGAIAPLILNEDRSIQQSSGYFPSLAKVFLWMTFIDDLPYGQYLKPYHIDHDSFYQKEHQLGWLTGAAILTPKNVIKKIGGFDPEIFMYGEDIDLCYRITKAGYKILIFPKSKIVHIGQGSSQRAPKNAIVGEYKEIIYLYKKFMPSSSLQILKFLLKMGALLRIFAFSILGRKELAKTYVEAFKVA